MERCASGGHRQISDQIHRNDEWSKVVFPLLEKVVVSLPARLLRSAGKVRGESQVSDFNRDKFARIGALQSSDQLAEAIRDSAIFVGVVDDVAGMNTDAAEPGDVS